MAASTNNYGFPYPEDSDTVDVAGDIQSLAEDIDTKLSEAIADTVGAMVTSNTESGITVTYDDADNTLDFVVPTFDITFLGDIAGIGTISNLGSASATISIVDDSHNHSSATISDFAEAVADTVGNMVTSNTENGISVTYDDTDNTLDFDVADFSLTFLGDVLGSTNITNLSSASATLTIAPNSVALGTDTTGNYVATAAAGTGIDIAGSGSETADLTITNTGVTSLAGTADEVTVSASAGSVTLSLPATINANTTGTAAALTTPRTIALTGDVTGSVSFDGSASASIVATIEPNSVALGTDTSGNYVATVAGTNNEIEVSGSGSESATITIGLPDNVTISNDLTVTGNLILSGSTAYINTTELLVQDNLVTLNSGTTGSPTLNAGIEIERGTSANTSIRWNESTDVWEFTNDGTNFYTIKDFDTALATKTTDNLTQGSTNLYFTDERAQDAISTAIAAGTQTNITVSYNDSTNSFSFISVDPGVTSLVGTDDEVTVSASAGAVTLSLPATINANTTGTAAALTTARTIELTGDVTGTVSFDGSASASMVTTVVNGGGGGVTSLLGTVNQVAVSASTGAVTLSLPANVDLTGVPTAPTAVLGTNSTQIATTAFVKAETDALIGVTSLVGTDDEVTVSASAGAVTLSLPTTINANTTGTAAALTTARTIELTGDVTGSVSFDGSASASMVTTVVGGTGGEVVLTIHPMFILGGV
jgi:cytoskeletal protein CcmA (bactofilin family)